MENQQQHPNTTTLCRSGCGFFGSPANEGLCSKCYKDHVKREQDATPLSPTVPSVAVPISSSSTTTTPDLVPSIAVPTPAPSSNRCLMCRKRVGLTGFTCRCGGLYCGEHRYDQAHNCSFDYKTMEREEIRKKNPVVVSDKIQRL